MGPGTVGRGPHAPCWEEHLGNSRTGFFPSGGWWGKRMVFQEVRMVMREQDRLAQLGGGSRGRTVPKVQDGCPRMKFRVKTSKIQLKHDFHSSEGVQVKSSQNMGIGVVWPQTRPSAQGPATLPRIMSFQQRFWTRKCHQLLSAVYTQSPPIQNTDGYG